MRQSIELIERSAFAASKLFDLKVLHTLHEQSVLESRIALVTYFGLASYLGNYLDKKVPVAEVLETAGNFANLMVAANDYADIGCRLVKLGNRPEPMMLHTEMFKVLQNQRKKFADKHPSLQAPSEEFIHDLLLLNDITSGNSSFDQQKVLELDQAIFAKMYFQIITPKALIQLGYKRPDYNSPDNFPSLEKKYHIFMPSEGKIETKGEIENDALHRTIRGLCAQNMVLKVTDDFEDKLATPKLGLANFVDLAWQKNLSKADLVKYYRNIGVECGIPAYVIESARWLFHKAYERMMGNFEIKPFDPTGIDGFSPMIKHLGIHNFREKFALAISELIYKQSH